MTVISAQNVVENHILKERCAQNVAEQCGEALEKCTFDLGYINQSVYVCLTCTPDDSEPAGMCLGCSMNCHLDHEIIELWARRDFRCDCGTKRLSNRQCCFQKKQNAEVNAENKYSHNFFGKYCYCREPETDDSGDMYMCSRCEDWFHFKCLKMEKEPEDAETFLCQPCAKECSFLLPYSSTLSVSTTEQTSGPKRPAPSEGEAPRKRRKLAEGECSKIAFSKNQSDIQAKGYSFDQGWTEKLCRCSACTDLLHRAGMSHIFDEDTNSHFYNDINIAEPETDAVDPSFSMASLASNAISQFPAPLVLDVITEQNRFHEAIKSELRKVPGIVTEVTMRDIIARVKNRINLERIGFQF